MAKPSNCSSQVKARLSKVGADLIQQVSSRYLSVCKSRLICLLTMHMAPSAATYGVKADMSVTHLSSGSEQTASRRC